MVSWTFNNELRNCGLWYFNRETLVGSVILLDGSSRTLGPLCLSFFLSYFLSFLLTSFFLCPSIFLSFFYLSFCLSFFLSVFLSISFLRLSAHVFTSSLSLYTKQSRRTSCIACEFAGYTTAIEGYTRRQGAILVQYWCVSQWHNDMEELAGSPVILPVEDGNYLYYYISAYYVRHAEG